MSRERAPGKAGPPEAPARRTVAGKEPPGKAPLRVLIAEDSPTQAERISLLLRAAGYATEVAPDGITALESVRSGPPDLLISDVMMPGLDGYQLCEKVKASRETRHVPVVLLTSRRTPTDIIVGLQHGADNFIPKPVEDDLLLERVRRILDNLEERRRGSFEMEVELRIGDRRLDLNTDQQQILELLFATSEELAEAHAQLEGHARTLAERIEERTRELAEAEARYRLLLDSAAEGVFGVDLEGRCTFANAACARMLGVEDAASLVGLAVHERFHHSHADGSRHPVEECPIHDAYRAEREVHVSDDLFLRADGKAIPVEYWSHPMYQGGRVVGAVVTLLDLSERYDLEQQLRQSQKLEAVGRLAGGVAHDFNNLLGVVTGYAELVLRDASLPTEQRRRVQEIRKASERATRLTRQLLTFSRREVTQPKVLDPNAVVRGMDGMLRRLIGEDVELVLELAPGPGSVRADPVHLEQVILNLVVNARDAMPHGGRIQIETRVVERAETGVPDRQIAPAGPYVLLAVTDDGAGMSAEVRSHVFEPFFTTKEAGRGTGLGLSTVYGIVRECGGLIELDSEPGRGTRFEIYLPWVAESPAATPPAPEEGGDEGSAGITILVVEDEGPLRDLVAEVLQQAGHRVIAAESREAALALSERHAGSIELLLTDVVLPGAGGLEVAEAVRAQRPGLPVLFMSGYASEVVAKRGAFGGPFLQKPFTAAALLQKVREALES